MTPVLNFIDNKHRDQRVYAMFWCPGCKEPHQIVVEGPGAWGYNGNPVLPTFTPSVLVRWHEGSDRAEHSCHSYVTDGTIRFLGDCTHALAGTTHPLAPWAENE